MIYDDGNDEWRYENEYPLQRTEWTKYFLHANPAKPEKPPQGLISVDPPADSEDPCSYDSPRLHRPWESSSEPLLAYVTQPLTKDLRLVGPISAVIYGSTHTVNTRPLAWFLKVADVAPDGKVKFVTEGNLKASYREVDEAKSRPAQPHHPFDRQNYVEPNEINDFQIELLPIFHTFKAGHKLCLQIASDDPGFHLTNYADAVAEPVPSVNYIHHDKVHPSHLLLPVIADIPSSSPIMNPPWDSKFKP
jgi:putative CocE/NonD family hydrolase